LNPKLKDISHIILLLYTYSSYDCRVIYFMSKSVYFLGPYVCVCVYICIYIYIYIYIQGVSRGTVNLLGGGSMDYSE
jgi:hypothetical protein